MMNEFKKRLKVKWEEELGQKDFDSPGFREALKDFHQAFTEVFPFGKATDRPHRPLGNGSVVSPTQPEQVQVKTEWDELRKQEFDSPRFGEDFMKFHHDFTLAFPVSRLSGRDAKRPSSIANGQKGEEDLFKKSSDSDKA